MNDEDAIDDDELLFRKVPVNPGWYDKERNELKPDALKPRRDDVNGISFDRAKSEANPGFRSIEEAAQGRSSSGYYVAVYRAGDLRSQSFSVIADPLPDNPGHALLTNLNYANRKTRESQEATVRLAHELVLRVEGPFGTEHL